jgi:hypothetical protein
VTSVTPIAQDCVCYLAALCHQHVNLPQLRNDLFSRMPLPCHRSYPPSEKHTSGRTTSKGADQDQMALIVRNAPDGVRELFLARRGMPSSQLAPIENAKKRAAKLRKIVKRSRNPSLSG